MQMAQKSIRDNQYVIDGRSTRPEEIWTLETPTRAVVERKTQAQQAESVKRVLEDQVQ